MSFYLTGNIIDVKFRVLRSIFFKLSSILLGLRFYAQGVDALSPNTGVCAR